MRFFRRRVYFLMPVMVNVVVVTFFGEKVVLVGATIA